MRQGFTAIKFDPAGPYTAYCGHPLSLDLLEQSATFCRRLRKAVGTQCDLIFGTHGQRRHRPPCGSRAISSLTIRCV